MIYTEQQIEDEARQLLQNLDKLKWSMDECRLYANMILEIKELKKSLNAIILAHSYQTPDIMYGIADFIGDSYGLSLQAKNTTADIIIFCSVHFMAETAKILNPTKEVRVPSIAGCSLAESITAKDIKLLKNKYPNIPVVCYINTTAEVKAECDVCVTSSNAVKVINKIEGNKIIFVPDKLMAKNIKDLVNKEIIEWNGTCIVHEEFTKEQLQEIRTIHPDAKILAHTECTPDVISEVDMAGGTSNMIDYIKESDSNKFMLVTECGLTDRMKIEFDKKTFVGTCSLCPYMKQIEIKDVLRSLKNPSKDQIINIDKKILNKAKKCIDRMIELSNI